MRRKVKQEKQRSNREEEEVKRGLNAEDAEEARRVRREERPATLPSSGQAVGGPHKCKKAAYPSRESLRVKSRPHAEFWADIALTLRVRLVTFPQDVKIFKKSLMDGDPALWRLSQRRFS